MSENNGIQSLIIKVLNEPSVNIGQKIIFRTPDYHDLLMLYDDGSDVAVWTRTEEDVYDAFPEATKTDFQFILVGFGREYDVVNVYKIPEFWLSDQNGNRLVIKNFHFAVSNRPDLSVDLVLPGNLFNNTITHIKREFGRIDVNVEYKVSDAVRTMGIRRISLTQKQIELMNKQGGIDIDAIISSTYCFMQ